MMLRLIMKEDLRFGKGEFISFILLDVFLLLLANRIAAWLYLDVFRELDYDFQDYASVLVFMVGIDLAVTWYFNTLCWVCRRRVRTEIKQGIIHTGLSFMILAMLLFSLRQGKLYSRVIVFMAYGIYLLLFIGGHIVWRLLLVPQAERTHTNETALLMTTDRFADEGQKELRKISVDVKYLYLLENQDRAEINGIPVLRTWDAAGAVICWEKIDKVYIYGLDHYMVPKRLINACNDMRLKLDIVDFNYRIIEVPTVKHSDSRYGALSFLENKRDIPFSIKRVYWITETEADLHRGFHSHKRNCQLLYCPYGEIDILLDDGVRKSKVTLDRPGKGLLLMPGLWREMLWKQSGSVLCVLASEYYDPEEYIRDYNEFLEYNRKYRESASPLRKAGGIYEHSLCIVPPDGE